MTRCFQFQPGLHGAENNNMKVLWFTNTITRTQLDIYSQMLSGHELRRG